MTRLLDPNPFNYEAIMNPKNNAGWSHGRSVLIIKLGIDCKLPFKEIEDGYGAIAVRVGESTVVVLLIRVHVNLPILTTMAMDSFKR